MPTVKQESAPFEDMPIYVPLDADNKAIGYACRCTSCDAVMADPKLGKVCVKCKADVSRGSEKYLPGRLDKILCQTCYDALMALIESFFK